MVKINAFNLAHLRIEEDFAFHQRVQQYAEELPTTGALIAEGLPEGYFPDDGREYAQDGGGKFGQRVEGLYHGAFGEMGDGSRRVARFRVVGIVLLCQGDDRPSGRFDCRCCRKGVPRGRDCIIMSRR